MPRGVAALMPRGVPRVGASSRFHEFHLEASSCLRCRREMSKVDRKLECEHYLPHRCSFCGKPLTDEAKARLGPPHSGQRALEDVAYE